MLMNKDNVLDKANELYAVIDAARSKAREDHSDSIVILDVIAKMADDLVGSIRNMDK